MDLQLSKYIFSYDVNLLMVRGAIFIRAKNKLKHKHTREITI